MRPDLSLQASDLAVDLRQHQVESRPLIATGFACTQIAKAVAHEVQRDLYDVQRLPSLPQGAVELDVGRRDQVDVIGKPDHLVLYIGPNLGREILRSIVNGDFRFGRILDRPRVMK
jgi:hypothetical protein